MEVQSRQLIVMTPSGEFYKIPADKKGLKEGEEIEFVPPPKQAAAETRGGWGRWSYVAAASILVLLSVFPLWNMLHASAYAAVSIDINPSLELELDKEYRVIDATSFNKEGKLLLDGVEWRKHSFVDVASNVIAEAGRQGFLKKNHDILIASIGLKDVRVSDEVVRFVQKEIPVLTASDQEQVTITLMKSSKEVREEARKNGMSAGKFALYESLKQSHKQLSKDSIKKLSVSEIRSQIGGIRETGSSTPKKDAGIIVKEIKKTSPAPPPSPQHGVSNKAPAASAQKHPAAVQTPVVKKPKKTVKEEKLKHPGNRNPMEGKSTAEKAKEILDLKNNPKKNEDILRNPAPSELEKVKEQLQEKIKRKRTS